MGSGGHAAVAWPVEYPAPIGETREGVDVARFDPAAGAWTRVCVGTGSNPDSTRAQAIASAAGSGLPRLRSRVLWKDN